MTGNFTCDATTTEYFHTFFGGVPMVIVVDLAIFIGFLLLAWLIWKDGFKTVKGLVFKRKSKNGKDTSEGDHIPDKGNPEDRDPEDQRSSKEISVLGHPSKLKDPDPITVSTF